MDGGKKTVLVAVRLRRVETPDDTNGGVRDDAPLDLARRLLGADEDDPERSPALGDVEQRLLDGAPAFTRRVFVQLVEHMS